MSAPSLAALVQRFFTERLMRQMEASPHTVAAYRDAFRLLLRFAAERRSRPPTALALEEIDAPLVAEFLAHLEAARGNGARSRNARLAAIRSFFRYVAMEEPAHLLHCQRVLALPAKRHPKPSVTFLEPEEVAALLVAPDPASRIGRRDRMILRLLVETGLRASELLGLARDDVATGSGAHVRCEGKGRKRRATPLRRETAQALEVWIRREGGAPDGPLFVTQRGDRLSRDGLERLVRKHAAAATPACPSLRSKRVTPHALRHTTAMTLLRHGVDQAVIALWLGHESVETTQVYLHADLRLKEQALARIAGAAATPPRFRADDRLLAFLEGL